MSAQLRSVDQLSELLGRHRAATDQQGVVDINTRKQRIQSAIDLLVENCVALCEAMEKDFGSRHPGFSLMNDVIGAISSLKHSRDNLHKWVDDEVRPVFPPYDQLGAKSWIQYKPKGTVGIIGTWNAPLFTLFSPLASVFAAGNRAILKPSEVVPETARLLHGLLSSYFDELDAAIIIGGSDVGAAFSSMPFDHLVFTGSTEVGRKIMRSAAENLVPVTLELGGKSPVIISSSADIPDAAKKLAIAKGTNGGQICISPDLIYVPKDLKDEFLTEFSTAYKTLYPTISGNPDVVSVVNSRHMARIDKCISDAKESGAEVLIFPNDSGSDRQRPVSVVVNPPLKSRIMEEEIFGPALVLLTYVKVEHVIKEINDRPRPLALYYFGNDESEQRYVLDHTLSGGVTINDAMMHAAMEDAPFGGVGASGMGHYHGHEGFLEFSHARTVFKSAPVDPRSDWGVLPPWSEEFEEFMKLQVTR